MFKTLKEFVKAVGKGWWGVTIDWVIGALIGTFQTFGKLQSLPAWSPYFVAIVGLVIACFIAFHRVRVDRDAAINKLSALQSLSAEILWVSGPIISNADTIRSFIFYIVVKNTGEPTIAENWSIVTTFSDGEKMAGEFRVPIEPFTIGPSGVEWKSLVQTYAPDDIIFRKTRTPIQKGAAVSGPLLVYYERENWTGIEARGHKHEITFFDIYKNQYCCRHPSQDGAETMIPLNARAQLE